METLSHRKAKKNNQKLIKFFILYGIFGSVILISVICSRVSQYFGCEKTPAVQEVLETEILLESAM